jgi:integral membrane sensor domain MASE1
LDRDVTPDNSDNRYGSAGGAGLECVTLGILVFLTAWGGIVLTQQTDRIAAIWAANAVLLSMLLGRPTRIWPSLLLSALIANIAADLVTGDELSIAVGLALCNSFEVLLVAVPMRILYAEVDLTHPRTLMLFGVLALGPAPFLSAMPAAGLLVYVKGATFWQVVRAWYPADALGLLTITPLLMTMRRTELAGLFRPARLPATLAVLAVVLAALMLMFGQSRYPLLFLGFPALLFAAFRLGPAGTTLAVAVMVAGALVATITGNGPLSTLVASMRQQVLLLQVFLAITAFTILQLAAVLAGRSRLEFALREAKEAAERSEAERRASAQRLQMTLDNMDQGLIMVDADGRISICNRRVLQLLDLPGDLIARQPHSSEVIAYQAAIGEFVGLSQETKAGLEPRVAESGFHVYERERPNGTALEIRTVSLPQGGVVRT